MINAANNSERARPTDDRPMVWVVVVTKPAQERRAKVGLEEQAAKFGEGFEVYLPLKLSKSSRRPELLATPFLPRYLFARVDLELHSWKRMYSTPGVHSLLGSSVTTPYAVADWVIARLRAQEDAGFIRMGLKEERAAALGFRPGTHLSALGGALEGLFVELVDDRRCLILISLLGRDSLIKVDLAKVRATSTD